MTLTNPTISISHAEERSVIDQILPECATGVIFTTICGSYLKDLATPASDIDLFVCYNINGRAWIGLDQPPNIQKQVISSEGREFGVNAMPITHFMKLVRKGNNPYTMQVLFANTKPGGRLMYDLQEDWPQIIHEIKENLISVEQIRPAYLGFIESYHSKISSGKGRQPLIDKYGYDIKNGSNTILHMGELLSLCWDRKIDYNTFVMYYEKGPVATLWYLAREIKLGNVTLTQYHEYYEMAQKFIEQAYKTRSPDPSDKDMKDCRDMLDGVMINLARKALNV